MVGHQSRYSVQRTGCRKAAVPSADTVCREDALCGARERERYGSVPAPEDSDAGQIRWLTAGDNVTKAVFCPDRLSVRCLAFTFPRINHFETVGTHVDDFWFFLTRHITTDAHELRISGVIVWGNSGSTASGQSKGGDCENCKPAYPFHEKPPKILLCSLASDNRTAVLLHNPPGWTLKCFHPLATIQGIGDLWKYFLACTLWATKRA